MSPVKPDFGRLCESESCSLPIRFFMSLKTV